MMKSFLFVGIGGAAGSMARYGVVLLLNKWWTQPFPLATFLINIAGCLIIGVLSGYLGKSPWLQAGGILLLATGFCGGFTTFSSFALENINLMNKTANAMALVYSALSVIIGLLLCRLGLWLAA